LAIHVGRFCGSVCNRLTRNSGAPEKQKLDLIKFEENEAKIDAQTFDEFFDSCLKNDKLLREW
jgi:hypothetical protein